MVIVGLVLLYGYNAVKGLREKQGQVNMIETENELRNTIKTMSSDYDSLKTERLQLPPNFKMICFASNTYLGTTGTDSGCSITGNSLISNSDPKIKNSDNIIKDAITEKTANIFLVPDGTINYMVGNIQLQGNKHCLCIPKTGNEAVFRIRGLGNGVEISST